MSYFRGMSSGLKNGSSSSKVTKEVEEWSQDWDWSKNYKKPNFVDENIVDHHDSEFAWDGASETTTTTINTIRYTGKVIEDVEGWYNGHGTSCSYKEVAATTLGKKCDKAC
jgi:hypothetical protein